MRRATVVARAALGAGIAVLAAACAKPYPPPGGETDRTPPRIVSTTPEARSVVPGFADEVRFVFDERIAERGVKERVIVSPETSEPEIGKGRSDIHVRLSRGWRPNTIYRVTVLPGLADLFNNATNRPYEVVFSTGPQIPDNVLAGVVVDRVTGKPVTDARFEALHLPDSLAYVTRTDSSGFYAIRGIPEGDYELRAYVEQIPNRKIDFGEPFASMRQRVAATDTLLVERLAILPADTTPAHVLKAEAKDSTAILVTLDDPIDPAQQNLGGVAAVLWQIGATDSVMVPVSRILFALQYEAQRAAETAARDSTRRAAARDSALRSMTPAARDSALQAEAAAARESARAGRTRPGAPRDTVQLPTRELVVVPTRPLRPDTRYRIQLRGITNIVGLAGGEGSAPFRTAAPPKPPTPPGNPPPTAAPPDTTRR